MKHNEQPHITSLPNSGCARTLALSNEVECLRAKRWSIAQTERSTDRTNAIRSHYRIGGISSRVIWRRYGRWYEPQDLHPSRRHLNSVHRFRTKGQERHNLAWLGVWCPLAGVVCQRRGEGGVRGRCRILSNWTLRYTLRSRSLAVKPVYVSNATKNCSHLCRAGDHCIQEVIWALFCYCSGCAGLVVPRTDTVEYRDKCLPNLPD